MGAVSLGKRVVSVLGCLSSRLPRWIEDGDETDLAY